MTLMTVGAAAWRRESGPPIVTSYWNPLDKAANAVLSDSDKVVGGPLNGPKYVRSISSKTSGKWRVQFVALAEVANGATGYGFAMSGSMGSFLGSNNAGFALWGNYASNTRVYNNNSFTAHASGAISNGSTIDLLLDIGAGKAWWRLNGTTISGDPVAGTGEMATFAPDSDIFLAADPFVERQSTRLRTHPSEITGASVSGFVDGWPD